MEHLQEFSKRPGPGMLGLSNYTLRDRAITDRMYTIRIPFLGRVFAATPNHDGLPDTSRWPVAWEWDRGELVIYLGASWWAAWTRPTSDKRHGEDTPVEVAMRADAFLEGGSRSL